MNLLNAKDIKIVLLEGIHDSAEEHLRNFGFENIQKFSKALEGEELIEAIKDAHLIGIRSRTQIRKNILEHAKNLLSVGCFCIGTNQVDLEDAACMGVPVFNAPHANTRSVSELVIGLIVMLYRGIFEKSMAAHEGNWNKSAIGSHEIRGKILGIVGYGHIGSQVSVLAESMGMKVIYYDILTKLPMGNALQTKTIKELYEKADIVTFHVPETPETKNMVNKESLSQMKKGMIIINYSRGTVVDIEALKTALDEGIISSAALDVFPKEPKKKDEKFISPLQGYHNLILTPHIGGSTMEAQKSIGLEVADKFVQLFYYGTTVSSVNFPQISVPPHKNGHRILHIHKNVPGVMKQINDIVGAEKTNIQAQFLDTKGEIGYVVFDLENSDGMKIIEKIEKIEGTIKARVLNEAP
jgi:D-3-phosphoglycerate dehydrogenase